MNSTSLYCWLGLEGLRCVATTYTGWICLHEGLILIRNVGKKTKHGSSALFDSQGIHPHPNHFRWTLLSLSRTLMASQPAPLTYPSQQKGCNSRETNGQEALIIRPYFRTLGGGWLDISLDHHPATAAGGPSSWWLACHGCKRSCGGTYSEESDQVGKISGCGWVVVGGSHKFGAVQHVYITDWSWGWVSLPKNMICDNRNRSRTLWRWIRLSQLVHRLFVGSQEVLGGSPHLASG